MTLAENQLHSSSVENLRTALTMSTIHGVGDESNENKSNVIQKGGASKIMNDTANDLIKIIPYEANITKV